MTTPVERTKTIEVRGSGAAFKSSDNGAQIHSGRVAEKEMDAVGFAAKLNPCCRPSRSPSRKRSEEHTSELQSQSNLVCRLLLEKKKNKFRRIISSRQYDSRIVQVNVQTQ